MDNLKESEQKIAKSNPKPRKQGTHGHQVSEIFKTVEFGFMKCFADLCVEKDPLKARTAQTQKWTQNCTGGQVVLSNKSFRIQHITGQQNKCCKSLRRLFSVITKAKYLLRLGTCT